MSGPAVRVAVRVGVAAALLLPAACGDGTEPAAFAASGAWARPTPAAATEGVVYLIVTSDVADELVGAAVPASVAGHADLDGTATFRFTHALCPVSVGRTRHLWRVSRNFALDEEVTDQLRPVFTKYYQRVKAVLETMQMVLDTDGPARQVAVSADAAALAMARILRRMVADEAG